MSLKTRKKYIDLAQKLRNCKNARTFYVILIMHYRSILGKKCNSAWL